MLGKNTQETISEDLSFTRRGQGTVISRNNRLEQCDGMSLDAARTREWGLFHFHSLEQQEPARGRNLMSSSRKERKSIPGWFSSQINSSQSS